MWVNEYGKKKFQRVTIVKIQNTCKLFTYVYTLLENMVLERNQKFTSEL